MIDNLSTASDFRRHKEKPLTHIEFSRKGGKSCVDKYGKEYMSDNGRKGGNANKVKFGADYFRQIRLGKKFKDQ